MGTSSQDVTSPGMLSLAAFAVIPAFAEEKVVVCYYSSWAFYRHGDGKFDIPDIDPHLCTHLNYGFANMNNQTWKLVAYDPWFDQAPNDEGCDRDHCHYDSFRRFIKLKNQNPNLKLLLSIGGWNSGSGQCPRWRLIPARGRPSLTAAFTSLTHTNSMVSTSTGNTQETGRAPTLSMTSMTSPSWFRNLVKLCTARENCSPLLYLLTQ